MGITPIPLYLLCHSAELITEYDPDKWGGSSEASTASLEHIRITPCRSQRFSLSADMPEISAKLFYDCVNSSPVGNPFRLKGDEDDGKVVSCQFVYFDSKKYTVNKIESFYGTEDLHHLEVYLS